MLGKLFSKAKKQAVLPENLRIYAVGDVHGRVDCLDALLALIDEDIARTGIDADCAGAPPAKPQLVFLGDYIDRGPDSNAVIDRLIAVKRDKPDTVFLKGNHEAAFLDFMTIPRLNAEWLHWGGAETLESYGLDDIWVRDEEEMLADLLTKIPEAHLDFLRTLTLTHISGDYLFVHAGLKPGVPLEEQHEDDLLWIRGPFHNARNDERPDHRVVHGHHPVKKPHNAGWRINVDTGAFWSGMLTAVVVEGGETRFISTALGAIAEQ